MKRPNLVWIAALSLGFLFDFLFWKHTPGINFAIYVVLCLVAGALALAWNGKRPSWKTTLLLIPILFFATMSAVRQEPLSLFLCYAFSLTLLAILTMTYLGGRWLTYTLPDYISNTFKLIASLLARPFIFIADQKKLAPPVDPSAAPKTGPNPTWKRTWAVLRGLLIALPIVAIFATLLSSADLVFAARLEQFIQIFRLERLPEYIFRTIYILFFAYALAGTLLHAGLQSPEETVTSPQKPFIAPFLGATEASIVLGAVNLLFLLFVIIQFQYFFGGQTNIGVEDYTYAEYARRGFSELVTVAFFSLVLFLGLSAITRRATALQRTVFSALGVLLVLLIGVILYSAFQRMVLYETIYGFTRLRTYTHVFMLWVGVLLAAVVVLELLRRERTFALAMVLAALGFAASIQFINVDAFIVRHNIDRAVQGEELDSAYLATLSSDAVPLLAASFADQTLPAEIRDAVGASLACRQIAAGKPDTNWRGFTFSHLNAARALRAVQNLVDDYTVTEDTYPQEVESPSGVIYSCSYDWMD